MPRFLDDASLLSLNGYINNRRILDLVHRQDIYRDVLRAIKLWSIKRGIYSTVMGYLGGASWALLVAKVCILYPEESSESLVRKFFKFYHSWDWSNPICLEDEFSSDGHYMCIYTPTESNSAYTLTQSGFKAILSEIELAYKISQDSLEILFEDLDFFQMYGLYLRVNLYAKNAKNLLKF